MTFNTSQTIAVCLGAAFACLIVLLVLFALYASRRAHKEDTEANAANLGRWKEVGEVTIQRVPRPQVRRSAVPIGTPNVLPSQRMLNEKSEVPAGPTRPEASYNPYKNMSRRSSLLTGHSRSVEQKIIRPPTERSDSLPPPPPPVPPKDKPGRSRGYHREKGETGDRGRGRGDDRDRSPRSRWREREGGRGRHLPRRKER